MSKVRYVVIRLVIVCIALFLINFIWSSGLSTCLTLTSIKENAAWLREQVTHYYWRTTAFYMCCYIAVVLASLPAVFIMNMVSGFLFGVIPGVLYAITAATIGAIIYFLLVRYVIGSYLQARYKQRLVAFNKKLATQGWLFLLTCRLVPVIPFFMINLMAGLLKISVRTFTWTTALGILPSTFIFVYLGTGLHNVHSFADIFSPQMLTIFALMILIFVMPVIAIRYRAYILR